MCRVVDGKPQLLKDVFDELNINPYDLSVDLLDCHADSNVYHRYENAHKEVVHVSSYLGSINSTQSTIPLDSQCYASSISRPIIT